MKEVDTYIASLPDWQQKHLSNFRTVLHVISPSVTEDIKWNVPVFIIDDKIYFAMSAFKAHTKYNFIRNGALISDPDNLFNNGFESKKSRGIDLRETDAIDLQKLRSLMEIALSS